jgi:integrase
MTLSLTVARFYHPESAVSAHLRLFSEPLREPENTSRVTFVSAYRRGSIPALHDVGRIILDQGMRPDEVMSLRVGDINLANGILRVTQGKTKHARRTLLLTPAVRSILGARKGGRMAGWVFEGKKSGTHLSKLNNAHDSVMKKIGAEFVLYEFRHTFATRFGESVGDPIALAAILGHSPSSLKLVMKYCHPQQSHTDAAMQKYIAANKTQTSENVAVN